MPGHQREYADSMLRTDTYFIPVVLFAASTYLFV
jgi:hypothetical protein